MPQPAVTATASTIFARTSVRAQGRGCGHTNSACSPFQECSPKDIKRTELKSALVIAFTLFTTFQGPKFFSWAD